MKRMRHLSIFLCLMLPIAVYAQDERFGIVEGFWFPEVTCDLGVGWERIIFNWEQHQPTNPTDWHTLNIDDRWLKSANACQREVVGLLKHTPDWATAGLTGAGVPLGLHLSVDDPSNYWANFVRQTAFYYAPRGVHRFIVWNEPDISADTYGFEFEGEVEDYAHLLKSAYLAAKQGNPSAQIHLAGTTYWHDVNAGRALYLERLLEVLAKDAEAVQHDYYFDVVSLHIYFRTDSIVDIVEATRAVLKRYGLEDKPIWINEFNAPPTQDPAWLVDRPTYPYTLEQQSAFIVQASALSYALGVERIAVYKLFDQDLPANQESFGLLRPDQTPRPAFYAYQAVIQHFTDVRQAAFYQTDALDAVMMQHEDDTYTLVAWARTDRPVELTLEGEGMGSNRLEQIALDGTVKRIPLGLEGLQWMLMPALCNGHDPSVPCPVGGAPLILSQLSAGLTVYENNPMGKIPLDFNFGVNE